jgi:DNA-binding protein YbaB
MDFPDLEKMQEMLAQAQQMQSDMDDRLASTIVEADSGGGAVTARMNGKKELLKLTITPSAASAAAGDAGVPGGPPGSRGVDITLLEDLIVAAINAASRKADAAQQSSAAGMLGNLGLPGL